MIWVISISSNFFQLGFFLYYKQDFGVILTYYHLYKFLYFSNSFPSLVTKSLVA